MTKKNIGNFLIFTGILLVAAGSIFGQLTNIPTVAASSKKEDKNFIEYLNSRLPDFRKKKVPATDRILDLCPIYSEDEMLRIVASRVLRDYGAIFVGDNNARVDNRFWSTNHKFIAQCFFKDAAELQNYQAAVEVKQAVVGGVNITLQKDAMKALIEAREEAAKKGLSITPRGGSEAAGRSYEDTARLWRSRFNPGLNYWVKRGRISAAEAKAASAMPVIKQVARVLEWENDGIFFSTDFSKSILYSVAAPGASQHVFYLALDVKEFGQREVRQVLERHGWFQTVYSDLPHFTYLGLSRDDLQKRGLMVRPLGGHEFWVPRID